MSLHGIAGPLEPSSPNLGNKWSLARPLTQPNFVALRQEVTRVRNIRCRKFVLPEKWTKVHQNRRWPAMHKWPSSCQISSRSVKRRTRKRHDFLHPSVFCDQARALTGQSSPIWPWRTASPLFEPAKYRPVLKIPVWDICCQISSISLTAWSTKTVNDMCPHAYHVATTIMLCDYTNCIHAAHTHRPTWLSINDCRHLVAKGYKR